MSPLGSLIFGKMQLFPKYIHLGSHKSLSHADYDDERQKPNISHNILFILSPFAPESTLADRNHRQNEVSKGANDDYEAHKFGRPKIAEG